MTQDARRPLHRLTPLHADPAAAWLTSNQRFAVTMTGAFYWLLYFIFLMVAFFVQAVLLARTIIFFNLRLPSVATAMLGVALFWPMRRLVLRRKAAKSAQLVRESAPSLGVAIDDLTSSNGSPTAPRCHWSAGSRRAPSSQSGSAASPASASRSPAIRSIRGCSRRSTTSSWSTRRDATVPIQVAGARMLGEPNVNLGERERAPPGDRVARIFPWARRRRAGTRWCCAMAIRSWRWATSRRPSIRRRRPARARGAPGDRLAGRQAAADLPDRGERRQQVSSLFNLS